MAAGAEADSAEDVQSKVLQTSSDEVVLDAPDCCVICLDTISEPCTAHPCAHAHFDFLCLLSWLQQRPSCPLCQSAVYKVSRRDAKTGESVYRVPNAPRRHDANEDVRSRAAGGQPRVGDTARNNSRARIHRVAIPPTPGEAIQRRRHIYRHQLYSLHVGSNRVSQYKPPPTPAEFAAAPHLVSRARLWIRRELQVFAFLSESSPDDDDIIETAGASGSSGPTAPADERQQIRRRNNAEFLLEYIIAILKTVDIQGSAGQAEDMLADFIGRDHARLFLHELRSWLRSPCLSVAAWDREVQYPDVHQKRTVDDRPGNEDDGDDRRQQQPNDSAGTRRTRIINPPDLLRRLAITMMSPGEALDR
ncbi:hypothetical protein B0T17DRAFT_608215 [Bombardia bombarda]|uniref:RING-type E3 ubiquitin transferase n=1 Tax=Bombardia bombarda TaxID=252184 RepID=A0AA40C503_9PEZI|nr:hypothetical protein B0T17DRAFT_608215 [Bombardia bombarda]